MDNKMKVFVILLGLLITLATGLLNNPYVIGEFPNVQIVTAPILGVGYSGMPLPWMKQVVYPDAPVEVIYSNLIVDLVFWIIVVFVVKLFYLTVIKGKPKKRPKRRARPKRKARPRKRRR